MHIRVLVTLAVCSACWLGLQRKPLFLGAVASSADAEVEFDVNPDGSFSPKAHAFPSKKSKAASPKAGRKRSQAKPKQQAKKKAPAVVNGPNPFGRIAEMDARAANHLVFGFGGEKARLQAAAMAEAARDGAIKAKSASFGKEPYSTCLFPQAVGGEDDEDLEDGVNFGGEDIADELEAGGSGLGAYPELQPARETSADPWVLMFYAPWCPHCKDFKGPLRRAAKRMQGKVHIAAVDGTTSRELASRFSVNGYPSIYLLRNGSAWQYNRPRTADALTWWATEGYEQDEPVPWAESPVGPVATAKALLWGVIDTVSASTQPTADFLGVPVIGVQFAIVLSGVITVVGGLVLCAVVEGGHCRRGGFKYEYEMVESTEAEYLTQFEGGGTEERKQALKQVLEAEGTRKDRATRRATKPKRKFGVQTK